MYLCQKYVHDSYLLETLVITIKRCVSTMKAIQKIKMRCNYKVVFFIYNYNVSIMINVGQDV